MPDFQTLAVASLLSVVNNGIVEYVFKTAFDKLKIDSWWLMYVSIATALGIAWVFQLNLFVGIGIATEAQHTLAVILTGLVIARGSNYLADLPWLKSSAKE